MSKTKPERVVVPPSEDMEAFREVLRSSKRIIAIAGAGLSAASGLSSEESESLEMLTYSFDTPLGIPTFRGAGGMWRKYDSTSLATPEAFNESPSRVWQFYHYRREKALRAQPNGAHLALNVDGLSQRAWDSYISTHEITPPKPAQPRMLEMHGRLFEVKCTSANCGHAEMNFNSPICEALGGTEENVEAGTIEDDIPVEKLPRCSKCGELARPGVVWFGEMPQHLDVINELVRKADLCLVVGTSSTVYPAASYAYKVRRHKGKAAVFNLDKEAGTESADFLFLGPCEQTLPECLGLNPTQ
ncbi:hypothetical protein NLI96_g9948 [Meripilus lineatus]|uniref:Deacetylase sirtuin-type domain-containing protein n=1 Tax=Meripilus lineatus TaxID=2056292 RepID=A0AAD5YET5_9APHY|nr:hypothetical protein NLI96_g9948 [Physisporinus lineatus]